MMKTFLCCILAGSVLTACKPVNSAQNPLARIRSSSTSEPKADELKDLRRRQKQAQEELSSVIARIQEIDKTLLTRQGLTAEEKASLAAELVRLQKRKGELAASLAAQGEQQVDIERAIRVSAAEWREDPLKSGFPVCPEVYYGILFRCGAFKCAKADAAYQNICEVTDASKPAGIAAEMASEKPPNGFPPCGDVYYGTSFSCGSVLCGKSDQRLETICELTANSRPSSSSLPSSPSPARIENQGPSGYPWCPSVYYGTVFACNGYRCAKSDPGYLTICELSAQAMPTNPPQQTNQAGVSGYPYCPATYYGTTFNCNGRACAKADPGYTSICELTASSRPANSAGGTQGASGYPYCPATYYGTTFNCNGRTCAKSDPNYANICEIR